MVLLHKFRYQTPADHKSGTFIRCMLHELTHMLAVSFPEIYGLTVEWLEMWACLKRISICQNGKWLTSIWRAIMSIIMKGCFIYWRYSLGVVDSACYLCKATISLVKGGGGKKINSMANHKPCLIRVTKWSPARCYTDCLILRLCMRKKWWVWAKEIDYREVLLTQHEVKEPRELIWHFAYMYAHVLDAAWHSCTPTSVYKKIIPFRQH